jgi:Arc/MetJ-type ribon-helix-helix transcriptional regulator
MNKKHRTSIYLDEQDRQAIQVIKERYGITSDSDVIRFALRLVAREEGKPYVPGETGEHRQDRPTR